MKEDFCTLWPEGWWGHCCKCHDQGYADQISRLVADWELLVCVATSGEWWMSLLSVPIAVVMFIGVRLFGGRFYKNAKKGA